MTTCSVVFDPPIPGRVTCDREEWGKGWCIGHYTRNRRYGDPSTTPIRPSLQRAPLTDRLAFYQDRSPGQGPNGDCFGWKAVTDKAGYAQLRVGGTMTVAHRVAWELANGPVPGGHREIFVRHKCDNPPCTRLDHLELGTCAQNAQDMVERGRAPNTKFTALIATEIRRRCVAGEPQSLLAKEFGVSKSTICRIVKRHTWKHVA